MVEKIKFRENTIRDNTIRESTKWEKTGEIFVDWLSKSYLREYFYKHINYKNFSLWWITNLYAKDNVLENKWYYQLKNTLFDKKKYKVNLFIFYLFFFLKLIKSLLINVLINLYLRLFFYTRYKKTNRKNCFSSIDYNFVYQKKNTLDRLYSITPIKKNKLNNYYLVRITKYKDFLLNPRLYKLKFKNLKIPFFISNEFISVYEILSIYLKCFFLFIKIFIFLSKRKNFFFLNNNDCYSVLYPLLIDSFSGNVQNSLIYAKSLQNFFNINKSKYFINYFEFNPYYRSVYYFLKKSRFSPKIITIQHAYASKNLLFYNNNKNEFSNNNKNLTNDYSPSPDIYMLQGQHFNKVLKKYFPKKKIIVGPLRYDLIKFPKKIIFKKNVAYKKKTILICPAIGDEHIIIDFLNKCDLNNANLILSPHPAAKAEIIKKFRTHLRADISFKIIHNTPTFKLFCIADLVLCGFSVVSIESILFGTPSFRILNYKHPHFFDLKDGIKIINDPNKFNKIINQKKILNSYRKSINKIRRNLFFKLDNKAYMRFWNFLDK